MQELHRIWKHVRGARAIKAVARRDTRRNGFPHMTVLQSCAAIHSALYPNGDRAISSSRRHVGDRKRIVLLIFADSTRHTIAWPSIVQHLASFHSAVIRARKAGDRRGLDYEGWERIS